MPAEVAQAHPDGAKILSCFPKGAEARNREEKMCGFSQAVLKKITPKTGGCIFEKAQVSVLLLLLIIEYVRVV